MQLLSSLVRVLMLCGSLFNWAAPLAPVFDDRLALLRRNGDQGQSLGTAGFGEGEEEHDSGERAFGLPVSFVNPKPVVAVTHGGEGVSRLVLAAVNPHYVLSARRLGVVESGHGAAFLQVDLRHVQIASSLSDLRRGLSGKLGPQARARLSHPRRILIARYSPPPSPYRARMLSFSRAQVPWPLFRPRRQS